MGVRLGVVSAIILDKNGEPTNAYMPDGLAASRAAGQVRLGRGQAPRLFWRSPKRFLQLVKCLPARWQAATTKSTDADLTTAHHAIAADLLDFGRECGWSMMGDSSVYFRPHVSRKLWFLLIRTSGYTADPVNWGRKKFEHFFGMFPDMKGFVEQVPIHWRWDMRHLARIAPEVPLSMHSCWTCMVNYATNAKYQGNSEEFVRKVLEFISAAARHHALADEDSPQLQLFEGERAKLTAQRGCVATPLMVLRSCIGDAISLADDDGDESDLPEPAEDDLPESAAPSRPVAPPGNRTRKISGLATRKSAAKRVSVGASSHHAEHVCEEQPGRGRRARRGGAVAGHLGEEAPVKAGPRPAARSKSTASSHACATSALSTDASHGRRADSSRSLTVSSRPRQAKAPKGMANIPRKKHPPIGRRKRAHWHVVKQIAQLFAAHPPIHQPAQNA
jgi:hypothetical protein